MSAPRLDSRHWATYSNSTDRRDRKWGTFRKGREFAAWVGLVPREYSTGGKQKLLSISKRGNSYLRKSFIQGTRAVLKYYEFPSIGRRVQSAPSLAALHRRRAIR
jgi:transposase